VVPNKNRQESEKQDGYPSRKKDQAKFEIKIWENVSLEIIYEISVRTSKNSVCVSTTKTNQYI
jgi:hypothetical protein